MVGINLTKTPYMLFSKKMTHTKHMLLVQTPLASLDIKHLGQVNYYLNASYIVFLYANWQVFIEEVVKYGMERVEKVNNIPEYVKELLNLSSDRRIVQLRNPNTAQVNEIMKDLFGIRKMSDFWAYDGYSKEQSISMLDTISKIRHQIVHQGELKETLTVEMCFEYMNHLVRLAKITEEVIRNTVNQ